MSGIDTVKMSAACFGGGLVGGILVSSLVKAMSASKNQEQVPPQKWIRIGSVSQLNIYPVKSLPGIPVQEAFVSPLGLKANDSLRDRVFMITNASGRCQTMRVIPFMTQIQASVQDNILRLNLNDGSGDNIVIPFPKDEPKNRKFYKVWDDSVEGLDCGDEVGNWLSKVTEIAGLRLIYHVSKTSQRKLAPSQTNFSRFSSNDTGSLQDETSYMMMTEESVEDLNSKLDKPIPVRAFRPCILIKGTPGPWVEDLWTFIKIGDENAPIFKTAKPCQRCKVTTMDPETGNVRGDGEPLKTLRSRKREFGDQGLAQLVEKDAIMGNQMGLFNINQYFGKEDPKIKVGDPVYAALM